MSGDAMNCSYRLSRPCLIRHMRDLNRPTIDLLILFLYPELLFSHGNSFGDFVAKQRKPRHSTFVRESFDHARTVALNAMWFCRDSHSYRGSRLWYRTHHHLQQIHRMQTDKYLFCRPCFPKRRVGWIGICIGFVNASVNKVPEGLSINTARVGTWPSSDRHP